MIDWLFATLKQYPEIAIFAALALGLLLRQIHLQGNRARVGDRHADRRGRDRADRDHGQPAAQGVFIPHVPVRRRLRGRAAVRARHCQRRAAAGDLLGRAVRIRAWSPAWSLQRSPGTTWATRPGSTRGSQTISAAMGLSTDAINRTGHGRPIKPRHCSTRMPIAYAVTYMFGHHGLGDRDRHPGSQAARHRSRRRMQGLRGEARRRDEAAGRAGHGVGTAGYMRAYSMQAGGKAARVFVSRRPRQWCPTRACSSCASAAVTRSSMRPRTPS